MPAPLCRDVATVVRTGRTLTSMMAARAWPGVTAVAAALLLAPPAVAQERPSAGVRGDAAAVSAGLEDPADSAFWAAFEWRSIGPTNFAGRITDIEALPSPSKTIYIAAASGGIWKSINNGTTWRPIFDDQRVVAMGDLAIAPSDPNVLWAGTGEEDSRNSISPGGGVFRSTDAGETWQLMGLEATQAIGRIVIHPENPDVVYVAALGHIWGANEERGLYRTRDGGATWERIHQVDDQTGFVDLVMHATDPNVLFAASWQRVRGPWFLQSGGPGSALWMSTDGGDTWTEVTGGGFPEGLKGRIGLAIAPSAPNVVYALVEAAEPGDSLAHDIIEGPRARAVAEAERANEPEETEGEEDEPEGPSGLYRSEDGGRTWTLMNEENTRPFYYSQVRVDPSDPDRVIWSSTPVRFSKDGGKTVGQASLGVHVDHHAMWWDSADPDRFIVGNDGGIAITVDKGGTYDFINNIPLGQFYAISLSTEIPYRVCGGLQDNGSWCGPSRLSDDEITTHHWATVNGGDGFYTAQDPVEPWIAYAESQRGRMNRIDLRSGQRESLAPPDWQEATRALRDSIVLLGGVLHGDRGAEEDLAPDARQKLADLRERITADSAALDLRFNWSTPFFISPHERTTLYAGANRVLHSTNRGDDWEVISPDLTYADSVKIRVSTETTGGITRDATGAETHATITALAESPLVQGRLLAGTDDGRVWIRRGPDTEWEELTERIEGVPEGTWVSRVEPSHHDPERFYVTFDGHRNDDFNPYVHVSDDGGQTFRSIASNLPTGAPDFVHVIREDPRAANLLFAGTDVGLYVSIDRGESWRPFMEGMPTVPVHDLKIHTRDRELVAGTHGRSFYIVDIAPLQDRLSDAMVAQQMAEAPVLFEPTPALQYGDTPIGGESAGHRWFEGDSPEYGAQITYWLPRDMQPDDATAESEDGGEPSGEDQEEEAARAKLAVLDAARDTVATLEGPLRQGLHRVYWDLDAETETGESLSPSERADSAHLISAVEEVLDSLVTAGEAERATADRVLEMVRSGDRSAMLGRFGGGRRGGGRTDEARPGESYPETAAGEERPGQGAAGAEGRRRAARETPADQPGRPAGQPGAAEGGEPDPEEIRDLMRDAFRALRDRGISTASFQGGSDSQPADPGAYTVVLTIGGETFERPLEVIRAPDYVVPDTERDVPGWNEILDRLRER